MVGNQRPGKAIRLRLGENITQAFKKIIPVLIIAKYRPAFNSAHDDMLQGSKIIDAGFAGHIMFIPYDPQL